jgi:hypothetical protein
MSENNDHDGDSGGRERRAIEPEEPYENVFGVRPAADEIPPGEPQYSIDWGSGRSKCRGVKTKAADFLGINRNTLNKKVRDLGIEAID